MARDEALYLDDKAIGRKIGLDPKLTSAILKTWEKSGFPRPSPLASEKRYWPAVRAFLDRYNGIDADLSGPFVPDGKENWDETPRPRKRPGPAKKV